MLLRDKIAVVTGGSRGIGKATVENFFNTGASGVVIADILEEVGRKTCEEMEKTFGQRCLFVKTDVTDSQGVRELFRKVMQEFGKVDILVNSAGITSQTPLADIAEEEWPWLDSISLWVFRYPWDANTYQDYYTFVRTDFEPKPIYEEIARHLTQDAVQ